ncbi:MAG: cobalt transporter CbiM [Bryobacteraceae bacterium]
MHIPDGYLSPSTCASMYAASTPFWIVAFRKVSRELHTRLVPLLSLFSAFSFVVMMFNVPLPGGTSGHAIGLGLAAAVLGPWASIVSISIALTIQALFFGDGGVTALGANCFNMAIAGSLIASLVYRAIAGAAPVQSRRRVWAGALGGYAGINVAALLAAIEFGIQPMFFKDSAGAPLYSPYPLHVAIPAMMAGHLTFAGAAEFLLSAGIIAYLQKTAPSLLRRGASSHGVKNTERQTSRAWPAWALLAAMMILTPLGLLTVGSAWGEWSPRQLASPAARQRIAAASGNVPPPAQVPSGLRKLSSIWTAPMPAYAPPVFKNAAFGYVMSALTGCGLILLTFLLVQWLANIRNRLTNHDRRQIPGEIRP